VLLLLLLLLLLMLLLCTACVVQYVFMDNESYEETRLARDQDWAKYLKEGAVCYVVFYQGKVGRCVDSDQWCEGLLQCNGANC
jgi:hypothetical protein